MITFKKCEETNLDLLHQIALQSYNETYQYLWMDGGAWYLDKFYKKEIFKEELSNSSIFYFLIYDEENPIGYFKLKESPIEHYSAKECMELDKLYLLKKYTGKGIGKTVMNFIISFSKEKNRSVLWLKVMESSSAKFLYEKAGFKQTDKYELDYPQFIKEYAFILTMILKL